MATQRLVLVDGSSLIYRAFFAIPGNFATSKGLPTNAIYGFATMFKKVMAGRTPEKAAVVFDAPGKTFRDEKYPEYKSHRPRMDPDLRAQLSWIDKVVHAHNFPLLRVPGYEADDVIATLASEATAQGMEVHIISGDKDFAQLIDDKVRMVDTLRDVVYTPELVRKKWGVPPHQFVDWQAMVGDKADNIPGVPGIGAKGAAQLLEKYGDLDTILANTEDLKGRQKSNLVEYADQARLSRELATLERKAELPMTLADLDLKPPTTNEQNELYRELEFFSLLSQDEKDEAQQAHAEAEYRIVQSESELDTALAELKEAELASVLPVFDLPSPVRGSLSAIAFSVEQHRAFLLPLVCKAWHGLQDQKLAAVGKWLSDESQPKVCHNAKELWVCLRRLSIDLRGVTNDIMLESFLVDPTKIIPHRPDQVAKEFLHFSLPPAKEVLGSGKKEQRFSELGAEDFYVWACQHADAILQCAPLVREKLEDEDQRKYFADVELPLSWILGAMEIDGILVDPESLSTMGQEFAERLAGYEKEIYEHAGREFNIASPKQLGEVLFDELKLPVIKRTKTGYSTKAEVLERLRPKHPIAEVLLEYRKLAKLINTYTEVLQREVNPATGRIHATFQQTVGATGRLITTEPDLQRTPIKTPEGRRIRETFVAPEGHQLVSADWSQIELRLLAHFSEDDALVEAFTEDLDVHARTAASLFDVDVEEVTREQRGVGKLVNFSTIYGQGSTALGQILGVAKREAQGYIEQYFETYSGVREWLDTTMKAATKTGYVTTLLGRRRYIPELSSNSFMIRQAGERIAANTPIQGSAADLCKLAMLRIDREMREKKMKARMLLQVHDELVFQCPPDEADTLGSLVKEAMEQVWALKVPLVADVGFGDNWAEAH